jgi:hypothetical protein
MNNGQYGFPKNRTKVPAGINSITNNVDNNLVTATGGDTLNGEANLTFDGGTLNIFGQLTQGRNNQTPGEYSHAEGDGTQAQGYVSHAEGEETKAIGVGSHTEGLQTQAGSDQGYLATIVEGKPKLNADYGNVTSEYNPGDLILLDDFAFENNYGVQTFTVDNADWDGTNTIITTNEPLDTDCAVVIGNITYGVQNWAGGESIGGQYSHAEGGSTYAIGPVSHAEGNSTEAYGQSSHAEGEETKAIGVGSHAEGYQTQAIGDYSHAEGYQTLADARYSHAEGRDTQAIGVASHAEGYQTQAIGYRSHAEGRGAISNGDNSHAEGEDSTAYGQSSHAEGSGSIASGSYSHAEGNGTQARGLYSHAEGESTQAIGPWSHAEGAITFAGSNQGYLATTVIDGVCTLDASYSDVSSEYNPGDNILFDDTAYDGAYGSTTFIVASSSYSGSNTLITLTDISVTCSQAIIGNITYGIGNWSGGYPIGGYYSHAEGHGTQAVGYGSHAEGGQTQAIGNSSHAEGRENIAYGDGSHAEGNGTQARGLYSHAEGASTQAIGDYSHAEGSSTQAIGEGSHAEGFQTIASGSYQHVSGQFNTQGDTTSLFIVGNGVSVGSRSDAFKVTPYGSIILPTTVSSTPGWTGVQGEMIFGDDGGGTYTMYVWLDGAWRTSSLA